MKSLRKIPPDWSVFTQAGEHKPIQVHRIETCLTLPETAALVREFRKQNPENRSALLFDTKYSDPAQDSLYRCYTRDDDLAEYLSAHSCKDAGIQVLLMPKLPTTMGYMNLA